MPRCLFLFPIQYLPNVLNQLLGYRIQPAFRRCFFAVETEINLQFRFRTGWTNRNPVHIVQLIDEQVGLRHPIDKCLYISVIEIFSHRPKLSVEEAIVIHAASNLLCPFRTGTIDGDVFLRRISIHDKSPSADPSDASRRTWRPPPSPQWPSKPLPHPYLSLRN